jgi:hypothetical protein
VCLERDRRGLDQQHGERQLAPPLADPRLVAPAQRLEVGDVGLVVLRDVGDDRPGEGEVLGAPAADAPERLALDGSPLLEARERGERFRLLEGPCGLGRLGSRHRLG